TGMSAGRADVTKSIGPFALAPTEWIEFLESDLAAAKEFATGDRRLVLAQTFAAGHAMHAAAKMFSAKTTPTPTPDDGPNVPSYLDLFLAYLTDPELAGHFADPSLDRAQSLSAFGLQPATIMAIAQRPALSAIKGSTTVSAF